MEKLSLDTDKQVFFYEQDFYVLSNFASFTLFWDDETMLCSEVAYHYERFARSSHSQARGLARAVVAAPSAHEAFRIAQDHKHFQRRLVDFFDACEFAPELRDGEWHVRLEDQRELSITGMALAVSRDLLAEHT